MEDAPLDALRELMHSRNSKKRAKYLESCIDPSLLNNRKFASKISVKGSAGILSIVNPPSYGLITRLKPLKPAFVLVDMPKEKLQICSVDEIISQAHLIQAIPDIIPNNTKRLSSYKPKKSNKNKKMASEKKKRLEVKRQIESYKRQANEILEKREKEAKERFQKERLKVSKRFRQIQKERQLEKNQNEERVFLEKNNLLSIQTVEPKTLFKKKVLSSQCGVNPPILQINEPLKPTQDIVNFPVEKLKPSENAFDSESVVGQSKIGSSFENKPANSKTILKHTENKCDSFANEINNIQSIQYIEEEKSLDLGCGKRTKTDEPIFEENIQFANTGIENTDILPEHSKAPAFILSLSSTPYEGRAATKGTLLEKVDEALGQKRSFSNDDDKFSSLKLDEIKTITPTETIKLTRSENFEGANMPCYSTAEIASKDDLKMNAKHPIESVVGTPEPVTIENTLRDNSKIDQAREFRHVDIQEIQGINESDSNAVQETPGLAISFVETTMTALIREEPITKHDVALSIISPHGPNTFEAAPELNAVICEAKPVSSESVEEMDTKRGGRVTVHRKVSDFEASAVEEYREPKETISKPVFQTGEQIEKSSGIDGHSDKLLDTAGINDTVERKQDVSMIETKLDSGVGMINKAHTETNDLLEPVQDTPVTEVKPDSDVGVINESHVETSDTLEPRQDIPAIEEMFEFNSGIGEPIEISNFKIGIQNPEKATEILIESENNDKLHAISELHSNDETETQIENGSGRPIIFPNVEVTPSSIGNGFCTDDVVSAQGFESQESIKSPEWREFYDNASGYFYYESRFTGESKWDKPDGSFTPYEEEQKIPPSTKYSMDF